MVEKEQILKAFEECLCKSHDYCSECYQQGPGFGFVCRNNVCIAVYDIMKSQQAEIVRCKDCEYWQNNTQFCTRWSAPFATQHTSPNWYCADAKRREENE